MLILLIILSVICYYIFSLWRQKQAYPPGPTPLPIFGNIPHLVYYTKKYGSIVEALRQLKKDYGPMYTVWFGHVPTVHITDYDLAQEAMVKKGGYFVDRWAPEGSDDIRNGNGLIMSNGGYWLEQRRFALHTLRNFGFGRNFMEERIMDEFELKAKELDKKSGQLIPVHEHFDILIGSIINRLLFNYRFEDHNAKEFYALKRKMDYALENFSLVLAGLPLWFQNMIPLLRRKREEQQEPFWGVRNFIAHQVEERLRDIEDGKHRLDEEGDDFCDAYLIEMKKQQALDPNTGFNKESMIISIFDLWAAGQDTTSLTLSWAMIYLLNNPYVEKKARKELVEVTGGNRNLSLLDKPKTPYLNAVINEIQRLASILNTNIFRSTIDDVQIGGHLIKKGTPITVQLAVIMSEESDFHKKFDFNPDRYFNGERLDTRVIPFGIGKRECLGKSLALAELYLIIGNTLLRYKLETSGVAPSMKEISGVGIMHRPFKYEMKFIKTHS